MGRMVLTFVVSLFMLLLSLSSAEAIQLRMALDDVIKISDHVVHGRVVATKSKWVENERRTNTAACAAILDGGFEGGTPNASWTETSTNFGTPLCTVATCGTGDGATGPLTGTWWAWFGGTNVLETGSLTQYVAIPANSTPRLRFYLWNGASSSNGTDFLKVTVDDDQIFSMVTGNPLYTSGYALVELDLTPYANGDIHALSFLSTTTGPLATDISVDDVAIDCSASPCNNGIIRIGPTDYPSVQAAMNAAGGGSTIMASAHVFTESPIFSQSGSVTLEGGYDCNLAQNSGYTAIVGTLTIEGTGTLIIENLIIR